MGEQRFVDDLPVTEGTYRHVKDASDDLDYLLDDFVVWARDPDCGCDEQFGLGPDDCGRRDEEWLAVPVEDCKELIRKAIILLDGGDPDDD